jgi:hypothetical protein
MHLSIFCQAGGNRNRERTIDTGFAGSVGQTAERSGVFAPLWMWGNRRMISEAAPVTGVTALETQGKTLLYALRTVRAVDRDLQLGRHRRSAVRVSQALLFRRSRLMECKAPPAHRGADRTPPRPNIVHAAARWGRSGGYPHRSGKRPAHLPQDGSFRPAPAYRQSFAPCA